MDKKHRWEQLSDVREVFPDIDQVGRVLIFNLRGNAYRLICTVAWRQQTIYVKALLSHAEYGKLLAKELPHRIRSDAEYDKWAAQLERIHFEGGSAEEQEYADLLRILLDVYDEETADPGAPHQALQTLMDARGISKAELGRLLNVTRAQATKLANGQRAITRETAEKLAKIFKVRPQTFWD